MTALYVVAVLVPPVLLALHLEAHPGRPEPGDGTALRYHLLTVGGGLAFLAGVVGAALRVV